MINASKFVSSVAEIAKTNPTYRTGGRGADGTCDCVGLIMGAMYSQGHGKYPMHSSNYFARYETGNMQRLEDSGQLSPGMAVYKARADNGQLNDRYKVRGRYYTGDLLDYYHVGIVTKTNPLEITHCTQSGSVNGIARDLSAEGWTHCGQIKGVDLMEDENGGATMVGHFAMVTSANRQPVKLRSSPNAKSEKNVIARLAVDTVVEVVEEGTSDGIEWSTVVLDDKRGYMMSKFLKAEQPEQPSDTPSNPYGDIMDKLDQILAAISALGGDG